MPKDEKIPSDFRKVAARSWAKLAESAWGEPDEELSITREQFIKHAFAVHKAVAARETKPTHA